MSEYLAKISALIDGDPVPKIVYLLAPVQWKIGTKREIRHPFLACEMSTYQALCKHLGRDFNRVEVGAGGKKYVVFEVPNAW